MSVMDVLTALNKGHKRDIAVVGLRDNTVKRIPFTSPRLNYMTYGGIPQGRISMFVGRESSGKTTTVLDIVKNAQKLYKKEWEDEVKELKSLKKLPKEKAERLAFLEENGPKKIYYFDAENTLDADWAECIGVDINSPDLIHVRLLGDTAEEYLTKVNIAASKGGESTGMIIIDSIAALVSEQIFGESLENKKMGGTAAVNAQWLRMFNQYISDYGITAIVVNQVIENIKNPYADFDIPGGNALKHYASTTLVFKKEEFIDSQGGSLGKQADSPYGNLIKVYVQKTKTFKPDRRINYYTLSYDYGIDVIMDVLSLAVEYGCIKLNGGGYYEFLNPETLEPCTDSSGKEFKIRGKANVLDYLRENPIVLRPYYEYISKKALEKNADVFRVREAMDGILIRYQDTEVTENEAN